MDTLQIIGLGVGTTLLCVALAHFYRQSQKPETPKQKAHVSPPSTPRATRATSTDSSADEPGSLDDDRDFEDKETGEKRKAASKASSLRKRRKNLLEQARVARSPGGDNSEELDAMLEADQADPLGLWKGKPTPVHGQGRVARKKKAQRPPIPAFAQLIDDEAEPASSAPTERKVGEKSHGRDTMGEDIDEIFATVRELQSDSGEQTESLKPIRKKPRNFARPAIPSFDAPPSDNDESDAKANETGSD